MSELKNWISFTQRRYIEDDVNRQWKQHNPDNTEKLHWEVSFFLKKKILNTNVVPYDMIIMALFCTRCQDIRQFAMICDNGK